MQMQTPPFIVVIGVESEPVPRYEEREKDSDTSHKINHAMPPPGLTLPIGISNSQPLHFED
ncbi:hypothetical protein D9757_013369 [Collybiopsis confluens]|uniref:Uncharacterized protein n=1 Tax=Collybiopsis confluens TaxID=2823264 RepID=A0A8H5GDQ1_9AGAR|nr:hypothetical protein D9757_013369 [Collybiopsis confluens]